MPRVKLQAMDKYRFTIALKVRVTDVNYGGHLGNDAVAGLLHQARIEVLDGLGASELNLGDGTTGLIQTDLALSYQGEAFMLDQLEIDVNFIEVRGSTFRMANRIRRNDSVIALAELGFAGYDYSQHKMAALPAAFVDKIK